MRIEILGVPIDALARKDAAGRLETFLDGPRGHLVATPNPEMLVAAHRDEAFRDALRKADLAIPDGFGLLFVSRFLGSRIPERITGVDFIDDLASVAARRGSRVYLLGGEGERVAERAAGALVARHPGLVVAGASSGGKVVRDASGRPRISDEALSGVIAARPDILLVAFGHGKQEEWIVDHLQALPSVRIAMGVGGAFDFLAGDARRAPSWLRRLGLEWLWRLAVQPWRWRRIWTAVAVFPYLAFTRKR